MRIVKLLRVNGSSEPNAALINDVDQEYPVFLESLHNAVYFNELLNSGYILTGMPCTFVKDGVSIYQLPIEDYTPTDSEMEEMYNYIGAPLPFDEIKSHIDESVAVTRDTPPTNFTITTRKDFLDYLDAIERFQLEDDFKPLNYFVSPEARFSIKEFRSPEYKKYVDIISRRRTMSLAKFHKLFHWLTQFGMSEHAQPLDVLDAYFAWGLDGVDFAIIGSHRENREAELSAGTTATPFYRKTPGFIDSRGNIFTPAKDAGVRWDVPSQSPTYIQDVTSQIPIGDSAVCEFQCRVQQSITVLEGTQYNAYYSQDRLMLLKVQYPTLRVVSPITLGNVSLDLAMPYKKQELKDYCFIDALARMLYDKRRCRVQVSSYKALTVCGTNPKTAMNYIATQDEMDKTSQDGDGFVVMDYDIAAFLNGDQVSDNVGDYLHGILDGSVNIDNIASAKEAESHVSTSSTFNEIYALHYVMGISLEEIYNKFSAITDKDTAIVFSNGDYKHTVAVAPLKMRVNGYLSDIQSYDLKCAKDCTVFNYVINAAREVGVNECDRHVGIEFYMTVIKPAVKEILNKIEEYYVDKVQASVADVREREQMLSLRHMFKLSRFYEIALNGTFTLPDKLGGAVTQVPYAQSQALMKYVSRRIENITTYCSYTVGGSTSRDMTLDMYCVNAYITPERVIPRKGYSIHEAAFYALWNDYSRSNPELHAQLIGAGVLPQGFQSWSSRYYQEQFVARDMFDTTENDSLVFYNSNAVTEQQTFPAEYEFHNVSHPIEYLFPGIYNNLDAELRRLPAPREGAAVVRLGFTRELTIDDMKSYLYPEDLEEEPEQYLVEFHGLHADGFAICDNIIDKMPVATPAQITVSSDQEFVYLPNEDKIVNFRDIPQYADEYGVVHLYDRYYVFLSSDGKLWEVRV